MIESKYPGGVVIGLCGMSGSGKTTLCKGFESVGVRAIDADKVYRELVQPNDGSPSELVSLIAEEFGEGVVGQDGSLNRHVLAGLVYGEGNEDRLKRLNEITHGPILRRTEEMIVEYLGDGAAGVIVDAPALFESGFDKKCDSVICVSAPHELLVQRIMARDSVSEEDARRRLASQIPDSDLRLKVDHVIENDGTTDLFAAAKEVFSKIVE